jgi:hypothetical protein
MDNELLVAFVYLLLRDHITLGDLFAIKYDLEKVNECGGASFENALMEQIAEKFVEFLNA